MTILWSKVLSPLGDEEDRPPPSFLDLPCELRYKIYELVIYDHDRTAVFLLRSVPRKVTQETDVDVKNAYVEEETGADPALYFAWPVNEGRSLSSGIWYDHLTWPTPRSANETLGGEHGSDFDPRHFEEPQSCTRTSRPLGDQDMLLRHLGIDPEVWHQVHEGLWPSDEESNPTVDGRCDDEACTCRCHEACTDTGLPEAAHDPFTHMMIPPEACLKNECNDNNCEHCAGNGLDFVQWDEELLAEENGHGIGRFSDDRFEEDEEHEDAHERAGMLYELKEPAILLTCKAIRDECRSVYYSANSFSWRFLWQQYDRPLDQFRGWARTLRKQDAQLITQLTFEGRHTVEEGVEFIADIDLLQKWPYFKVKVATNHGEDAALAGILHSLEKELMFTIWSWLSSGRPPLALIPERIIKLGEVFVKFMQSELDETDRSTDIWKQSFEEL